MKRCIDEESEEEVFERRRKVHRQETKAKDEIEDLFEEDHSSETLQTEEDRSEETKSWGVNRTANAGIFYDIFGDGTDYNYVLEILSRPRQPAVQATEPVLEAGPEAFNKFNRHETVSRTAEYILESTPTFPKEEIERFINGIIDKVPTEDLLEEAYYCMDTPANCLVFLQAQLQVEQHKKKEKILQCLSKTVDKQLKIITVCAHTLKQPEEYSRLIRYIHLLQTPGYTEEEKELAAAVTQKLTNISSCYMDYAAVNNEETSAQTETPASSIPPTTKPKIFQTPRTLSKHKGLIGNPWLHSEAIEIGMDMAKISILTTPPVQLAASKISHTDMLLLKALSKNNIKYTVTMDKDLLFTKLMTRLSDTQVDQEVLEKSVRQFIDRGVEEICRGVERDLLALGREAVKQELFSKVLQLLSIDLPKAPSTAFWLCKNRFKYTTLDSKKNVINSGYLQPTQDQYLKEESFMAKQEVHLFTGAGYKLKSILRRKDCLYVNSDLLAMLQEKDLSKALAQFVSDPVDSFQYILDTDKPLPNLVFLQDALSETLVREVCTHALYCRQAELKAKASSEYISLRKDLQRYLESGGDICNIDIPPHSTYDAISTAIKETITPHTGWKDTKEDPVITNHILKNMYIQCIAKLRHSLQPLPYLPLTARDEFLVTNSISEQELFELEIKWTLSSGTEISIPSKVFECIVLHIGQEVQVRLSTGVTATLYTPTKLRPQLQLGYRLFVTVQTIDIQHNRITVVLDQQQNKPICTLRAKEHPQVKTLSFKGSEKHLKNKPLGTYIIRLSSTYSDSIILTIKLTESTERCLCVHHRVKEASTGYEIESKHFKDIDSLITKYIPQYIRTLKAITAHPQFIREPPQQIEQMIAKKLSQNTAFPHFFSLSQSTAGGVLFQFAFSSSKPAIKQLLLYITSLGLFFNGKTYKTPADFIAYIKSKELSAPN
ncbi:hypothetical protein NEOKW01_2010 [Nematocida sp. AWRm80]|nr:hypothetical protein NEOKW01_2010 [Nematocida sp. AWRm80]